MDDPNRGNWWGRNWKWVVPVGCLGSLVLVAAFVVGIAAIVFAAMRSSGAYSEGVELARSNKTLLEELGEPVEPGWLVTGSIHVSGPSGNANLAIPLCGSRNTGTLFVVAFKSVGEWRFERAEVQISGRRGRINPLTDKMKE